jgi:isoleucyl-tRNA synthetase
MLRILDTMTRLMAPVLSFMAEEVWQHIPGEREESIFLSGFPEVDERFADPELEKRWAGLIDVRDAVNKAIEIKRAEKVIGNSLEAKVTVYADKEYGALLSEYESFLPTLFIVSQTSLRDIGEAPSNTYRHEDGKRIAVLVEHAEGQKCSRCWNWAETVGTFPDAPEICHRCHEVLKAGGA